MLMWWVVQGGGRSGGPGGGGGGCRVVLVVQELVVAAVASIYPELLLLHNPGGFESLSLYTPTLAPITPLLQHLYRKGL